MIGSDLINKRIIVFGGSGQIGFALVRYLANNSVNVLVADIDEEHFLSKMGLENGSNVQFMKCDVSNELEVEAVFVEANNSGGYSGVVNCIHFKGNTRALDTESDFFADYLNYPEEAWQMVHDVNLKGTFLINRCAVKFKPKDTRLSLVNVSSTYGLNSPNPIIYGDSGINSPIAYASSKSAIVNLTKYIAVHAKSQNVRANVLTPGGVFNNQDDEFVSNYSKLTVLNRMAEPEDYIGGFVFLLSESSSYMTGANLIIDGGWTAW